MTPFAPHRSQSAEQDRTALPVASLCLYCVPAHRNISRSELPPVMPRHITANIGQGPSVAGAARAASSASW